MPGSYTLTVSDKNGVYADVISDFILSTDSLPATFEDKIVKTADATDEQFSNYLVNIATININGTDYKASGRKSVKLVNEDGSINLEAAQKRVISTFQRSGITLKVKSNILKISTFIL